MRPKGILALVILVAVALVVSYVFSDKLIERGMEKTGENIVGARIEIDNLKFSLADLNISLDRLQVTNPNNTWSNLFETGSMSFDMEWTPLARRKFIINDITVADIRIGTKRESDGKLPETAGRPTSGWAQQAKASLEEKLASVPILELGILKRQVNVDSLISAFDIQSLDRLNELKGRADSTHSTWRAQLASFDPKDELEKIGSDIKQIKPQEIKGAEDLVATFERTKEIHSTLTGLKNDVDQKKSQASAGFQQLTSSVSSIDQWIARDLNAIKSKANLGDFTRQNIGTMIFGQNLVQSILNMLPYIDMLRKYMPVAERLAKANKVESPPRFAGQDIRFPIERAQPDFLIEKIFLSGATNQADTSRVLRLSGEVHGITSHPRLYGKPLDFQVAAKFPQSNAYQVSGLVDHTGETPNEEFEIKASGFRLGKLGLSPRPYLPSEIAVERANISSVLALHGDQFDFRLNFTGRPVKFGFADSLRKENIISKLTAEVFRSLDRLELSASIQGGVDNLGLEINSNIDNLLADRIKGVMGESARIARAEIEQRLLKEVQPRKDEVFGLVSNYQNQVLSEINKIESGINQKLALVDQKKKEIEELIKKEKDKGLKNIGKKLTDIIKN